MAQSSIIRLSHTINRQSPSNSELPLPASVDTRESTAIEVKLVAGLASSSGLIVARLAMRTFDAT